MSKPALQIIESFFRNFSVQLSRRGAFSDRTGNDREELSSARSWLAATIDGRRREK